MGMDLSRGRVWDFQGTPFTGAQVRSRRGQSRITPETRAGFIAVLSVAAHTCTSLQNLFALFMAHLWFPMLLLALAGLTSGHWRRDLEDGDDNDRAERALQRASLEEVLDRVVRFTSPGDVERTSTMLEEESLRMGVDTIGDQKADVIFGAVATAYSRFVDRHSNSPTGSRVHSPNVSLSFNILDMGSHHGDLSLLMLRLFLRLNVGRQITMTIIATEEHPQEVALGRRLMLHAIGNRTDVRYHAVHHAAYHGPFRDMLGEVTLAAGVAAFDFISFDQNKDYVRAHLNSLLQSNRFISGMSGATALPPRNGRGQTAGQPAVRRRGSLYTHNTRELTTQGGGTVVFCDNVLHNHRQTYHSFQGFGVVQHAARQHQRAVCRPGVR
jgi:hypothetical protein